MKRRVAEKVMEESMDGRRYRRATLERAARRLSGYDRGLITLMLWRSAAEDGLCGSGALYASKTMSHMLPPRHDDFMKFISVDFPRALCAFAETMHGMVEHSRAAVRSINDAVLDLRASGIQS